MKLNFRGMAFLVDKLTKSEMWAIYLMGFDKEMPDQVSKADLVRIICVLCKRLDWIEVDPVEAVTTTTGEEIIVTSLNHSSFRISEKTNDRGPETEPLGETSLFGSKTANNDLEGDRNVSGNEEGCQENYDLEIITTAGITGNEKIDMDTNVLNQLSFNVERSRSMELTKEEPNEAKVENTGKASDTCDLPHKCLICNQKFSKENYLEAHVFMTHENNDTKLSSCDNNLETNESAHAVEKTFSCFQCNYKCQISRDLKRHERIHTGEKPFKCSHCDKKCNEKGNLKEHERIHTGEKPFKCSHCDKKCRTKANLKEHERIHTGNKPFSCSYCDYKCSRSSTLKVHERSHTGEKPFKCSQCDYKSSTSGSLKQHERIHTGDKPFSCSNCDKKFGHSNTLENHKLKCSFTGMCDPELSKSKLQFICPKCQKPFELQKTLNRHLKTSKKCGDK